MRENEGEIHTLFAHLTLFCYVFAFRFEPTSFLALLRPRRRREHPGDIVTPRARIRSRCAHGGSRSRPRPRAPRRGRYPPPLGRILQLLLRVVQQPGDLAVLLLEVGQFGREILLRVAVGLLQ